MNKFNARRRNIARERRVKRAEKRQASSGDPSLKVTPVRTHTSISGKRQRRMHKKWLQAQREALETGLVSMQDIEMMAADGEAGEGSELQKTKPKKKRVWAWKRTKLRIRKSGSSKAQSTRVAADADGDTMMQ